MLPSFVDASQSLWRFGLVSGPFSFSLPVPGVYLCPVWRTEFSLRGDICFPSCPNTECPCCLPPPSLPPRPSRIHIGVSVVGRAVGVEREAGGAGVIFPIGGEVHLPVGGGVSWWAGALPLHDALVTGETGGWSFLLLVFPSTCQSA